MNNASVQTSRGGYSSGTARATAPPAARVNRLEALAGRSPYSPSPTPTLPPQPGTFRVPDKLPAGTFRSTPFDVIYRTRDGAADYGFSIEGEDDNRRIFILDMPSYKGRNESQHSTHRLGDERKYICWKGDIPSLEDALAIAARWADCTQAYITTGRIFDEEGSQDD